MSGCNGRDTGSGREFVTGISRHLLPTDRRSPYHAALRFGMQGVAVAG